MVPPYMQHGETNVYIFCVCLKVSCNVPQKTAFFFPSWKLFPLHYNYFYKTVLFDLPLISQASVFKGGAHYLTFTANVNHK